MAYIEPNTTIQFLNVPFDPDYENTMYWETLEDQDVYMTKHKTLQIQRNSYQRKSKGVIRVGWTADLEVPQSNVIRNLYNSNYMRYTNNNYENKWFYAFVKQVEYVNNNTVDVYYEIDVMQTWALDYQLLECFIEREHTITDDVGEHTVPEQVEHGEYFDTPLVVSSGSTQGTNHFEYTPAVCLLTTFEDNGDYIPGDNIHGKATQGDMYSGLYYNIWQLNSSSISGINDYLETISGNDGIEITSKDGVKVPKFLADGVVAMFMLPYEFANGVIQQAKPSIPLFFDIRTSVDSQHQEYLIGSYSPRNKKLMCYPYNFIYITNNQGGSGEFRWEDFNTPLAAQFNIWGNVAPNGGMYITPAGYKGYSGENPDEMLQINGFPLCSWSYDAYRAWLAQNAGTIGAGAVGLIAKWATVIANPLTNAVTPIATGATDLTGYTGQHTGINGQGGYPVQAPSSGLIGATLGAVGQLYDHSRRPPQAEGNGNTSLTYQSGYLTFYYYRKHIKEEYAEIIDAFFDMYGYKTNRVGVPNRGARPCYSFIKTVGCAVDGMLPADDAKKIQAIFDKGIRFWKDDATFGVYSPLVNDNRVTIVG